MRIFRGPCHYGHELLPDLPFGLRELVTRGIIVIQRKMRKRLTFDINDDDAINAAIGDLIAQGKPCLLSRFGTGELEATIRGRDIALPHSKVRKALRLFTDKIGPFWWDNSIRAGLCNNAGFFPPTPEMLQRFSDLVLRDVREIDLLGAYPEMPARYQKELYPQAKTLLIHRLEPFWSENPWTYALKGRKVLVIHSMPQTIISQYGKRQDLFANPKVLPEFELLTYKSVNSAMGLKTEFNTWFDALAKMEEDIAKIDFDVALIGCGAYGMNLGAFIKRDLHRQALHLGGRVQMLFGIRGKRWDADPAFDFLYNNSWTRPLPCDTPEATVRIENSCYW